MKYVELIRLPKGSSHIYDCGSHQERLTASNVVATTARRLNGKVKQTPINGFAVNGHSPMFLLKVEVEIQGSPAN